MATILFTWELGGGLGHVLPMRPLVSRLVQEGHRILLAARDQTAARSAFVGENIAILPIPRQPRVVDRISNPVTFPHILHNVGLGNQRQLESNVRAWRETFAFVRPDLLVLDASPFALLASRGVDVKRALIGTGFFCPPD